MSNTQIYWIRRESNKELVGSFDARTHREALSAFLASEDRTGWITQDKSGGRYFAEIDGERFIVDLD